MLCLRKCLTTTAGSNPGRSVVKRPGTHTGEIGDSAVLGAFEPPFTLTTPETVVAYLWYRPSHTPALSITYLGAPGGLYDKRRGGHSPVADADHRLPLHRLENRDLLFQNHPPTPGEQASQVSVTGLPSHDTLAVGAAPERRARVTRGRGEEPPTPSTSNMSQHTPDMISRH